MQNQPNESQNSGTGFQMTQPQDLPPENVFKHPGTHKQTNFFRGPGASQKSFSMKSVAALPSPMSAPRSFLTGSAPMQSTMSPSPHASRPSAESSLQIQERSVQGNMNMHSSLQQTSGFFNEGAAYADSSDPSFQQQSGSNRFPANQGQYQMVIHRKARAQRAGSPGTGSLIVV